MGTEKKGEQSTQLTRQKERDRGMVAVARVR